jgi:hypothetical protein
MTMVGGPPHSGVRVEVGSMVGVELGAGVGVSAPGELTRETAWGVLVAAGRVGASVKCMVGRDREGPRGLFQLEARREPNTTPVTSKIPRRLKRTGLPHFGKDFIKLTSVMAALRGL